MLLLPRFDPDSLLHEGAVQVSAGVPSRTNSSSRRTAAAVGTIRSSSSWTRASSTSNRYFDVAIEYAKASANDILIRIEVANRGPEAARLHVLPTLWFRNTWSWGRTGEGYWPKPRITRSCQTGVRAEHTALGAFELHGEPNGSVAPTLLFTDNETNYQRLFGAANTAPYVKDAFNEYIVHGRLDAVNPELAGTKAALHYSLNVPAQRHVGRVPAVLRSW